MHSATFFSAVFQGTSGLLQPCSEQYIDVVGHAGLGRGSSLGKHQHCTEAELSFKLVASLANRSRHELAASSHKIDVEEVNKNINKKQKM